METYPKYYRLEGRAICRKTDTTGIEVQIPENPKDKLPLIMAPVVFPTKERFDEAVLKMEATDLDMFETYVKHFTGRVYMDIDRPMTERSIQKQLINTARIGKTR